MDGFKDPLRGLPFINTDASVGRVITLPEKVKLTISADVFNLFNNVTFTNPSLSWWEAPSAPSAR